MSIFDFFTGGSDETTVDDFDSWGMNSDWSDSDDSVWDDSTSGGNWLTNSLDFVTNGIDAYYDTASNHAIRQANLDQIRLQNGVPQPTNVTAPMPVANNDQTALIAGAIVLAGVVLLKAVK